MIEFSCCLEMGTTRAIKFSPEWLERSTNFDGKSISLKTSFARQSDFEVKCLVCVTVIHVKNKGYGALTQHMNTDKHKDCMKTKLNDCQKKLKLNVNDDLEQPTSSGTQKTTTLQLLAPNEETTKAELLLLMNGLSKNC